MNDKAATRRQKVSGIILTLPFLCAVTLLIIGLFSLDDIYLDKGFSVNFTAITLLSTTHIVSIIILVRLDKIDIDLPVSKFKKAFSIIGFVIMTFIFSFLLDMGLRMNLNYWLKSNTVEKIELIVIDKNISYGKATDYYIVFNSNYGRLKNKIGRRKYGSFSIGETYKASVNSGFFEGFFLTEPMNKITD
ncbi:hypothetical protein ACFSX9_01555 [Flavobacterium ardleyense]|uniref:Uncharacterized protein n=1 Tax=Flavobacterium ardleyense TaxID=2038737 RepID=A0ABW5Z513_9FLAO